MRGSLRWSEIPDDHNRGALRCEGGAYFSVKNVEPWDASRDARGYIGPYPVVAHPPCERFGRWAGAAVGRDGGCFASALRNVRRFGGVLEHPEGTHAWKIHSIASPPRNGGWIKADSWGWTCCVEQGHYGHRARKATWLYAVDVDLIELHWGPSEAKIKPRPGRDIAREIRIGAVQRMCRKERAATPIEFRELLLRLARTAAGNRWLRHLIENEGTWDAKL